MTAPSSPPQHTRHASERGVSVVQAACIVLLAVAVVILRRPDMVLAPQLWGEDAAEFFMFAELEGGASILRPFAGCIYLFPRLVAWAALQVPLLYLPTFYMSAALAWVAVSLWCVVRSSLASSPGMALALALAVVAAPYSAEVWGNLPNTHWFSALVIVSACVRPRGAAQALGLHATLLLFVLTGPSALVLLPVAGVAAWWRTDRWRWVTLGIVTVGAVATGWAMTMSPRNYEGEGAIERIVSLGYAVVLRYHLQVLAATFLLIAVAGWRALRARELRPVLCALTALLFGAAAAFGAPNEALYAIPGIAGRYVFVPWIASSWLMTYYLVGRPHLAALLVGGLMLTLAVWRFPHPARHPVDWRESARCLEQEQACAVIVAPYEQPLVLPGRGPG